MADTSLTDNTPEPPTVVAMPKPQLYTDANYDEGGKTVLSVPAELLHFDYAEDAFASQAFVDAKIVLSRHGEYNCTPRHSPLHTSLLTFEQRLPRCRRSRCAEMAYT